MSWSCWESWWIFLGFFQYGHNVVTILNPKILVAWTLAKWRLSIIIWPAFIHVAINDTHRLMKQRASIFRPIIFSSAYELYWGYVITCFLASNPPSICHFICPSVNIVCKNIHSKTYKCQTWTVDKMRYWHQFLKIIFLKRPLKNLWYWKLPKISPNYRKL